MSTATVPQAIHLHWSRWFHCETSFSLSLVPNEPGIYAIAEEVAQNGAPPRRTLNIIVVRPAPDLFHALSALYTQGCPLREKLEKSRCFIRYAAVADPDVRHAAVADLQQWLDSPDDFASPFVKDFQHAADPAEGPYRTKGD